MRSQRLIAAAVVIALSGALAGCSTGLSNLGSDRTCSIFSTPRRSCRASASRSSPAACRAWSRACRRTCTRATSSKGNSRTLRGRGSRGSTRRRAEAEKRREIEGQGQADRQRTPAPAAAPDGEAAPEEEGSTAAAPPAPKAQEDRAPANHGAAARCGRAAGRATRGPAATGWLRHSRRRCPAAHSSADLNTLRIDMRFVKGAGIAYVLHHRHHRPAQCRQVDAVQSAGRAKARAGR